MFTIPWIHMFVLQVRDLGLGYDSDEMVLFKYCSGACPRVTSNHELTLTNLRLSGALPPAETWHHTSCCRPTRHEDMAFLDNTHRWHKVEKLSASACSCIGWKKKERKETLWTSNKEIAQAVNKIRG